MSYQINFPSQKNFFESIQSSQQLKQLLNKQSQALQISIKFRVSCRKAKYIYAKCINCQASLTYHLNELGIFRLIKFNNKHEHYFHRNVINSSLINFLKDVPNGMSRQTVKQLALNQIAGITQSKFYYYYRKLKSPTISYSQLLSQLDRNKYEVLSQPFEPDMNYLPDLILIISIKMKQMFLKYNDFAGFDLTYHCIKQRKEGYLYKLGAFIGLSASRRLVPFALVVSLYQTKKSYYSIFKSFGNVMGRHPYFYITDESASIKSALKELQQEGDFVGEHILDNFHYVRNIRKRLIKKDNIKYFTALLKCNNQWQYEIELKNAYQQLQEGQLYLLKDFDLIKNSIAFSHIKNRLIGFSCSNNGNEKFHDLLKSKIVREQYFTKTIQVSLKLIQELLNKCQFYQIQRIPAQNYSIRQLKQIRFSVDKKIFHEFCLQLPKSYLVETLNIQEQYIELRDNKININLIIRKIQNKWICPCKFTDKTGVPCYHILKICFISKQSIVKQFHPRWLITLSNKSILKRKIGQGKISRRNRK